MNILMVLPFLKAGGTERQASYIANYLHKKSNRVSVLSVESIQTFESLFKVPVYYLDSKSSILRLPYNLFLLVRYIVSNDVEMVISRAWNGNVLSGLAAYLTRRKVILFLSGSIDLSGHGVIKKSIYKFIYSRADKIISVSKESKQNCVKWLRVSPDKIEVIYNGVDTYEINSMASQKAKLPDSYNPELPTIVFTGSMVHRKGVDILLEAFSKVCLKWRVNLVLIGEGEKLLEYKELSKKLNVSENVYFVGEHVNPFPFMNLGSIFVLPSRGEGFPNVVLEAMSLKKAVIASDCKTGPREIIDQSNGTLIPVGDVEELSTSLENYIIHEEIRKKHSEEAYKTIQKKFSLEKQLECIKDEIESIFDNN
jgi:glycosyltransferase involved in cell wall biosynthesis